MNGKAAKARVTAVVVTYQSAETLPQLLACVQTCHALRMLDCVFVDNDSKDRTAQILAGHSHWAEVILTGKNNGFGRGCNIGLTKVHSDYTLFLNPDAQIEPETIESMVTFMDSHPQVGIAGPATICGAQGSPSSYQMTGKRPTPRSVLLANIPILPRKEMQPIFPGSAPFRTEWVCGAIFMIRTDLARSLKGFDPRFFLYWEEMDLCKRAEILGFETWAVGNAVGHHICGASSEDDGTRIAGCIAKDFYQSRRYYMIKHHGWLAATLSEAGEFVWLCLRTAVDVMRGKGIQRLRPRLQAPLFSQPDRETI